MLKVGTQFQHSFTVDETVYFGFISLFQDNNPLHTNEQFAQAKGFKSKVMHGNILNGFISYFVGECLPDKNVIIHSQEIKYLKPVYLNDKLEMKVVVDAYFESVQTIEFKFYFENQDRFKIARGKISIGIL